MNNESREQESSLSKIGDKVLSYCFILILVAVGILLGISFWSSIKPTDDYSYAQIYAPNGDLVVEGEVQNFERSLNDDFVTITINETDYYVDEKYVIRSKKAKQKNYTD